MSSKKKISERLSPVLSFAKKAGDVVGPVAKEFAIIAASAAATAVSSAVLHKYGKTNQSNNE